MMYWLSHCTLMISMTIGVIRFQLVGCEKVSCFHLKRSWGKVQIDLFYPKTSSVPKTIVKITEVLVLFLSCSQFVSMHHLHAKYTKTLQLSKPYSSQYHSVAGFSWGQWHPKRWHFTNGSGASLMTFVASIGSWPKGKRAKRALWLSSWLWFWNYELHYCNQRPQHMNYG